MFWVVHCCYCSANNEFFTIKVGGMNAWLVHPNLGVVSIIYYVAVLTEAMAPPSFVCSHNYYIRA